jgi:nucleoside permease NupC
MARIDNLQDYGVMTKVLKQFGGSLKKFIKVNKTEGALSVAPYLLIGGAIIGGAAALKGKKILDENPEKVIKTLENINNKIQEM